MSKWEYQVVFIEDHKTESESGHFDSYLDADKYSEKLNQYGQAGWELVSFEWEERGAKAAFKRQGRS